MVKIEKLNEEVIEDPILIKYKTTYKGEEKIRFNQGDALAFLLLKKVLFIHFDEAGNNTLNLNCNELFYPGSDYEVVNYKDIEDIYSGYKEGYHGLDIWAIKRRGEYPQKYIYEQIQEEGKVDLDSLGLTGKFI